MEVTAIPAPLVTAVVTLASINAVTVASSPCQAAS
jgi:hypothetical protein